MNAIECQNLHAAYDKKLVGDEEREVLKGITCTFRKNRATCILGENGSGKTTLLRALTGSVPTTGIRWIDGADAATMNRKEVARRIAVMTQLSEVYFSYTVYETVMLGRYLHQRGIFGRPSAKDRQTVQSCIRRVGLQDFTERQIGTLSGGQLQRVFLARTFAQGSPILLLDEPTNHLDLRVQAELVDDLNRWKQEEGHTLIGVFHDIALAMQLADDVVLMKDGRIAAADTKEQIIRSGQLEEIYGFDVSEYYRRVFLVYNLTWQ